jgi:hypothetical protein
MEDRTPRQPDRLLEAAHRGSVVAELGEAAAGAVKDLTAPCRQMILADLGHAATRYDLSMLRSTYCKMPPLR